MANDQNGTVTPTLEPLSSPECIAWLTVLNIEAVAIVTINALTIIIYLKERGLRKRSMYLVISLAVADMFVTYNLIVCILSLGNGCKFWSFENSIVKKSLTCFFPSASIANLAAISLERMHATFRPFKHPSSKRRYLEQLLRVFGLQLSCLQLSFFHHFSWAAQISLLFFTSKHHTCHWGFVAFLSSLFLTRPLWNASSASWYNQKRKKTDQDIVHCNNCIVNTNDAIYNFLVSFVCYFRRNV